MRDYDPTTGRYIQADPLGLVDGPSVYGYALQNPMRYTDPTGEFIPAIIFGFSFGYALGDFLFNCEPLEDVILSIVNPFNKAKIAKTIVGRGGKGGKGTKPDKNQQDDGTLTQKERDELQAIADEHNTTIDVVGSRAAGRGRNINKPDLSVGKGEGTRSDINTRVDTTHPKANEIIDAVNNVGGGAGNASTKHSTAHRKTRAPYIGFRPK